MAGTPRLPSTIAVRAEGLGKRYLLGEDRVAYDTLRDALARLARPGAGETRTELWALRNVTFELEHGHVLGLIGPNGAGKTTLLKILAGITEPTTGRALVRGRVGALLEVGTGFHPELSGRENIFLSGALLGMSRDDIRRRLEEIVQFSDVGAFLDTPIKRYSSGMQLRLAFSVAAHLEPEILVIDEVLAIGDAEFQRRCLGKLQDASSQGRTVLFVSHNLQAIRTLCDTVICLKEGGVVDEGDSAAVTARYLNSIVGTTAEVLWSGHEAPGGLEARLRAVRVLENGTPAASTVRSSSELMVEMDVELGTVDRALCIGFQLDADGSPVLWSFHNDGPEAEWPALKPGRNLLRCRLPRRLLNAGRHTISPKIGLHYIRWIIDAAPMLAFDVALDHSDSPLWMQRRPGVVAPVLEWAAAGAFQQSPEALGASTLDPM